MIFLLHCDKDCIPHINPIETWSFDSSHYTTVLHNKIDCMDCMFVVSSPKWKKHLKITLCRSLVQCSDLLAYKNLGWGVSNTLKSMRNPYLVHFPIFSTIFPCDGLSMYWQGETMRYLGLEDWSAILSFIQCIVLDNNTQMYKGPIIQSIFFTINKYC